MRRKKQRRTKLFVPLLFNDKRVPEEYRCKSEICLWIGVSAFRAIVPKPSSRFSSCEFQIKLKKGTKNIAQRFGSSYCFPLIRLQEEKTNCKYNLARKNEEESLLRCYSSVQFLREYCTVSHVVYLWISYRSVQWEEAREGVLHNVRYTAQRRIHFVI